MSTEGQVVTHSNEKGERISYAEWSRKAFLKMVEFAYHVVDLRNSRPVLQTVRIQTRRDTLLMSVTDLERSLLLEVPCSTVSGLDVCVSVARLKKLVKSSKSDSVELAANHQTLYLKLGSTEFTLQGEDPEEFPLFPLFPKINKLNTKNRKKIPVYELSFEGGNFVPFIPRVLFAADSYYVGKELDCLWLDSSGSLYATNGGRLSFKGQVENEPKWVRPVSIKTSQLISKIFDPSGQIHISFQGNTALFHANSSQVSIYLYDRYESRESPRVRTVLPPRNTPFILDRRVFQETLTQALDFHGDKDICLSQFTPKKLFQESCGIEFFCERGDDTMTSRLQVLEGVDCPEEETTQLRTWALLEWLKTVPKDESQIKVYLHPSDCCYFQTVSDESWYYAIMPWNEKE